MNYSGLLVGILPLFIFVLVDAFAGLKTALISTVLMAVLEAVLGLYLFHEIDSVTIFSLITVVLFAYISFHKQNAIFIKIQPVLLSTIMGSMLLISYFMGEPLLLTMMSKYKEFYPPEMAMQIETPMFQRLLTLSTLSTGIALFFHAVATAIAAFYLSNWWWLVVRGVGFYLFVGLGFFIQRVWL